VTGMAVPGLTRSRCALPCAGVIAAAALSACSAGRLDADRLELATIPYRKEIPKSSPGQFVGTFDRFCSHRPAGMASMDDRLRAAGFVPRIRPSGRRPGVYVVDDNRPAVMVDRRICGVRAVSRTGQTDRVNRYIAKTYPTARPIDPAGISKDVEQAWAIPGGLIATTRTNLASNRTTYSLILFNPEG